MISVITPVHNAVDYIDATVDMMLLQDHKDWEWILVENGSTDGTKEKLGALDGSDDRIRVVSVEENEHGAAGARNIGLSLASGRYIAYLDADDIWKPDKLSKQLKFMEQTKAAFSFTSYEFGDENAVGTGRLVRVPESLDHAHALSRTVIFTSTVMFDTEKIDKDLLMMPYIESEDTATWWNILRTGIEAKGLDEVLTIYRRPAKSLSSNKLKAIRRIWRLYREQEKMGVLKSAGHFVGWAVRATARRL